MNIYLFYFFKKNSNSYDFKFSKINFLLFFYKISTNATCTLKKIKIIIQSVRRISIYVQSACHTVYHVSKYAQSYERGFSGFFFLRGRNPNRKFYRGENRK